MKNFFIWLLAITLFACTSDHRVVGATGGGTSIVGQYTVTANYTQPAIGSTVAVTLTSTQGLLAGMWLQVLDTSGNTGLYNVASLSGATATLTNKGGYGGSTAGTTFLARAQATIQNASIGADLLTRFGNGADGPFTPGASGTTVILRDMYYSSIGPWPSGSTAQIITASTAGGLYKIFCNGTIDLRNAPSRAISLPTATNGATGGTTTGGSAGAQPFGGGTVGTLGTIASNGSAGGTGTATNGGNVTTVSVTAGLTLGGVGGTGGVGGNGSTGTGGNGGVMSVTTLPSLVAYRVPVDTIGRQNGGIAATSGGGIGGGGGGGGGGLTAIAGGGGGGGGCPQAIGYIAAMELFKDSSTAAGALGMTAGNGGNGFTPISGIGAGGGGAGAGGGGGTLFLIAGAVSGTAVTNLVQVNGGAGGTGGNADGAGGTGGGGGAGGQAGRIDFFNLATGSLTEVFGAAGTAGNAQSGGTGGTGGAGGQSLLTL